MLSNMRHFLSKYLLQGVQRAREPSRVLQTSYYVGVSLIQAKMALLIMEDQNYYSDSQYGHGVIE